MSKSTGPPIPFIQHVLIALLPPLKVKRDGVALFLPTFPRFPLFSNRLPRQHLFLGIIARRRPATSINLPILLWCGTMPEHFQNTAENMVSGIMDAIADKLPKQKSVRFSEEGSISSQAKKLFGGDKSVHHILGGGKSADVLLWRNKKISSSVLVGATAAWVFFEWLDYHFLTIISFVLVLGMAAQFGWSSFSGMLNGSSSKVPRVELPEEVFANIGAAIGSQVNKFLGSLQDISCGRDLKQFLMAIAGFVVVSFIGSWFNLISVIYIGFVSAHTLPVIYEKYHDQIDEVLYNMLGLIGSQYQKLDKGFLSKIPKGSLKFKKSQ